MACLLGITNLSITGDCSNTNSGAFEFTISGTAPSFVVTIISPYTSSPTTVNTPPYLFSLNGLSADTYTVQVVDSCIEGTTTLTRPITISSGTCVSIESSNTTCGSDNGGITATTQNLYGSATFSLYENTNGLIDTQTVGTQDIVFTVSAGTYYVVADDGGGCTGKSETCIVKTSTTFNYDLYVVNDAGCASTGAGAIYVINQNGIPPYTYSWSPGGQTTSFITGLTVGNYSVTVTDSSNCSLTKPISISVVPSLGIAGVFPLNPTCLQSNGEVTVVITGGTGPYFFLGNNGQSTIQFGDTFTFTGCGAGNFIVTVTDAAFCTATSSVILTTPNGFSSVLVTTTNSTCSATDGSVSVSLLSPLSSFVYTIEDSSSTTIISQTWPLTSWSYVGLVSDTYTLTISGGNCSYTTTFTVSNTPLLTMEYDVTGTTCNLCNGAIELFVSGGSGNYTYALSPSPSNTAGSVTIASSAYTFIDVCPGVYQASITNNSCTITENIIVPTSTGLIAQLFATNPTAYSNNGSLNLFITSGTPPFTINWSSNVNGQTGLTVSNLSAGTYSVQIIDANGCVSNLNKKLVGTVPVSSYQTYSVCNTDFTNNGLLLVKGIKQMLVEGYYDLTSGETNCILNDVIFTSVLSVGDEVTQETFYTGDTLDDYPSSQQFVDSIENLLSEYKEITGVTINIDGNDIKLSTPCNTLSGVNIKIDLKITYDISCEGVPTPTPTPTLTPTPTPTQTPIPPGICEICEIGFDVYSANTVGLIYAGNLTGSCDASITDYKINWIGPAPSTNVAYTSGKGTLFPGYSFTHPLTGIGAIPTIDGSYTPIIESVEINGTTYTNLDCFSPVQVNPFTCSNGDTSDLPQYEHKIEFSGASSAASSTPVSASFEISASTKYIPWMFQAFTVSDELKISFSGSSYPTPLTLDYWKVGQDSQVQFDFYATYPFSARTNGYLPKVICLTGLTVNNGDKILIDVIPNTANTQTNWKLYFTCLEEFECETCSDNKIPYKISGSTISVLPNSCDDAFITLKLSGCSTSEYLSTDMSKYLLDKHKNVAFQSSFNTTNAQTIPVGGLGIYDPTSFIEYGVDLSWEQNYCTYSPFITFSGIIGNTYVCKPVSTNTITYQKYINAGVGEFLITCSDINDMAAYYNSYTNTSYAAGSPFNSLAVGYYRYFRLGIPNASGTQNCGEGGFKEVFIHPSTVVTTGGTGPYTIKFTLPLISNDAIWDLCDVDCPAFSQKIVDEVNNYSTGVTTNFTITTNTGSAFQKPFLRYTALNYFSGISAITAYVYATQQVVRASIDTIPTSGITYTQIPEYSASTCNTLGLSNATTPFGINSNPPFLGDIRFENLYAYKFSLINQSDPTAFSISAATITNGVVSLLPGGSYGNYTTWDYNNLVYVYSGGTTQYSNPLFII